MRLDLSILLLILLGAGTATSATFQLVDPPGNADYTYRIAGQTPITGTTIGPIFPGDEVISSPGQLAGFEFERTDIAVTLGGWARTTPEPGFFAESASFDVGAVSLVQISIDPEAGENIGDPITVWIHTKAFIVPGLASHDVWVVRHRYFGLPTPGSVDVTTGGWTRTSESFEVSIGDIITLGSSGQTNLNASVTTQLVADARLQLSFTGTPPPDPPIAGAEVPMSSSGTRLYLGLMLGMVGVAGVGRSLTRVDRAG